MSDNENNDESSCFRNSSEVDAFGVSWGEELVDSPKDGEPKAVKSYACFYLRGEKYCQDDTIYVRARDGPPYIGRIGKLYETTTKENEKKKLMHVRWFSRPCELPEGLADVDYGENCKDVFMMWGDGSKNANNPGCTLRHCKVLCTSEEAWNTNTPSIEEVAAADHIFDRAYDLSARVLRPLEIIVKRYGVQFVTGEGGGEPRRAPGKKRAGRPEQSSASGRFHPEPSPRPLAMRASSSDVPSLSVDAELRSRRHLGTSQNALVPLRSVAGHTERSLSKSAAAARPLKASSTTSQPGSLKLKNGGPAHTKAAEERTVPKSAKHESKGPVLKPGRGVGSSELSKKRPREESADLTKKKPREESADLPRKRSREETSDLPKKGPREEASDAAGGTGEHLSSSHVGQARVKSSSELSLADALRRKGLLNSTLNHKSRSDGKKPRAAEPSDRGSDRGMEKKPKVSSPHLIRDVAQSRDVKRVRPDSSSPASGVRGGDLRSPRDGLTNPAEKESGRQLALIPESSINRKLEAGLRKAVNKFKQNVFNSKAMDEHNIRQLTPLTAAERNFTGNSSIRQQGQGIEAHRYRPEQRLDGRVPSLQASKSLSLRAADEPSSNLRAVGNKRPPSPSWPWDVETFEPLTRSPKIVLSDVTQDGPECAKEQSSSEGNSFGIAAPSSGRHTGAEHLAEPSSPPLGQNGARVHYESFETIVGESSDDGVERRWTFKREVEKVREEVREEVREKVREEVRKEVREEVSETLPRAQNLSPSNEGKVITDDVVFTNSRSSLLVGQANRPAAGDSQTKLAVKSAGPPGVRVPPPHSKKKTFATGQRRIVIGLPAPTAASLFPAKKAGSSPAARNAGSSPPAKNAGASPPAKNAGSLPAAKKGGSPLGPQRPAGTVLAPTKKRPSEAELSNQGGSHLGPQRPAATVLAATKKRPSEVEVSNPKTKAARQGEAQHPIKRLVQQQAAGDEVKSKQIDLVARNGPIVSSKKRIDEIKVDEKPKTAPLKLEYRVDEKPKMAPLKADNRVDEKPKTVPQKAEGKAVASMVNVQKLLNPEPASKRDDRVPALGTATAPSIEPRIDLSESRKKKIFNVPWEEILRIALEQGKALHLQNLDPLLSSSDIETMLEGLLRVTCDVRVLPPKSFTCYISGEALVLFRTHKAAMDALRQFRENLFICSEDERPVLVNMADLNTSGSGAIHGFYKAEQFASRNVLNATDDQKNAVGTSHCSQPNTVEYEMGVQWRLLQDRQAQAWIIADKELRKSSRGPKKP